jgi:hypothetical protein
MPETNFVWIVDMSSTRLAEAACVSLCCLRPAYSPIGKYGGAVNIVSNAAAEQNATENQIRK